MTDWQKEFGSSKSLTSWITSSAYAMINIAAPISSGYLLTRFDPYKVNTVVCPPESAVVVVVVVFFFVVFMFLLFLLFLSFLLFLCFCCCFCCCSGFLYHYFFPFEIVLRLFDSTVQLRIAVISKYFF